MPFDEEPSGARPDRFVGVRTEERVTRHTVDQIVDSVPGLLMVDVPVPLMVDQLRPRPVSSGGCHRCAQDLSRGDHSLPRILCEPQPAEQLVEVPTILYFLSRKLTFQFLVVVGDSQIFKVFSQNKVQQLLAVKIFKVLAQDWVQQRHPLLLTR